LAIASENELNATVLFHLRAKKAKERTEGSRLLRVGNNRNNNVHMLSRTKVETSKAVKKITIDDS